MTNPTEPIKTGVAIPKQPEMSKEEAEKVADDYFKTNEQPKCKTCRDTGRKYLLDQRYTDPAYAPPEAVNTIPCPDCQSVPPHRNLMILDQTDNCIKVAIGLLGQLKPKTEQVEGCIGTLKAWQDNNLKHLKGAFK